MTLPSDDSDATSLSPDDAFSVLGNETRVDILRTLGEADDAVPFSELRTRAGVSDSGQFNYHLDRLVGHFVARTDDGYELRRAGERVIEAVLSGAVTDSPVLAPTEVDQSCQFCGAPIGVRYRQERVRLYCTECAGAYGERGPEGAGDLGALSLPPAGVQGRTADELLRAAYTWGGLATMAAASGVCPRCSAAVEESVDVCADHERSDDVCGACGNRYALVVWFRCTNCIYEQCGAFGVALLANTDLLAFLTARGLNPAAPASQAAIGAALDYDEELVSADPFEARFTYAVDDAALTLTVGDDLSVVDVTRGESTP